MSMIKIKLNMKPTGMPVKQLAGSVLRACLLALIVTVGLCRPAMSAPEKAGAEKAGKLSNPLADERLLWRLKTSSMRHFSFHDKPRKVPETVLLDEQGSKLSTRDWRGRMIVLNFWAPWCDACRRELPSLDRLYMYMRGQKFDVVAVNVDEDRKKAQAMMKKLGVQRMVALHDKDKQALKGFTAIGIPTTVLIDCHGRELGRLKGAAHWDSDSAILLIKGMMRKTGCWK